MRTVKERAEEYARTGFSGNATYFDPVRVRDFLAGFDLALEMLINGPFGDDCPQGDPQEWAHWLQKQRGENE